jgi:hypothetical protein
MSHPEKFTEFSLLYLRFHMSCCEMTTVRGEGKSEKRCLKMFSFFPETYSFYAYFDTERKNRFIQNARWRQKKGKKGDSTPQHKSITQPLHHLDSPPPHSRCIPPLSRLGNEGLHMFRKSCNNYHYPLNIFEYKEFVTKKLREWRVTISLIKNLEKFR